MMWKLRWRNVNMRVIAPDAATAFSKAKVLWKRPELTEVRVVGTYPPSFKMSQEAFNLVVTGIRQRRDS